MATRGNVHRIFISFTMNANQVIQFVLIVLVGTDICVRVIMTPHVISHLYICTTTHLFCLFVLYAYIHYNSYTIIFIYKFMALM